MSDQPFTPAGLDDPFYYVNNVDTVLDWVGRYHSDILTLQEQQQLATIVALPIAPRALLYRLIMRRGVWFRDDKLHYPEIGEPIQPLHHLADHGLINYPALCRLTDLAWLCRVSELLQLWTLQSTDNTPPKGKDALLLSLAAMESQHVVSIKTWWPDAPFELIKLQCQDVFDLVTVLFFGNAQQDWSTFVVAELGHQRYESVALTNELRPFDNRMQLDAFMKLTQLQEALINQSITPSQALDELPPAMSQPWVEYRRQKLLFRIGHQHERQGNTVEALKIYRSCQYREAKVRQLRLMEKTLADKTVCRYAGWLVRSTHRDDWREAAQKVWQRSAKRCGLSLPPSKRFKANIFSVELPKHCSSVEYAVQEHLNTATMPCFYVENALFPGLFALTFWHVIYAPIKGAFFNPFQRRPADLFQSDFLEQRQHLVEQAWQSLQQDNYSELILSRYREKVGITNPFAIWGRLNEPLITLALDCISRRDLTLIFTRMWANLRQHSSGFPDLIQFDVDQKNYRMIEVKGPGDRLQDHQTRWLAFFDEHSIDASVCHVTWQADE